MVITKHLERLGLLFTQVGTHIKRDTRDARNFYPSIQARSTKHQICCIKITTKKNTNRSTRHFSVTSDQYGVPSLKVKITDLLWCTSLHFKNYLNLQNRTGLISVTPTNHIKLQNSPLDVRGLLYNSAAPE